jgi:hypothetical protein
VPPEEFKIIAGTPKSIAKTADSGKTITSYFCGDCGSTLYRDTPTFGENKIVKVGILDDPNAFSNAKPGLELFTSERVSWVTAIEGAQQNSEM